MIALVVSEPAIASASVANSTTPGRLAVEVHARKPAGVTALAVSVPVCTSALVANSTIPCAEADAGSDVPPPPAPVYFPTQSAPGQVYMVICCPYDVN